MGRREKIDCRANGEVIFRARRSLYLKVPKHVVTGSSARPNESHSLISTKNGIDSLPNSLVDPFGIVVCFLNTGSSCSMISLLQTSI